MYRIFFVPICAYCGKPTSFDDLYYLNWTPYHSNCLTARVRITATSNTPAFTEANAIRAIQWACQGEAQMTRVKADTYPVTDDCNLWEGRGNCMEPAISTDELLHAADVREFLRLKEKLGV